MDLPTMRARVRVDLHDEDSDAYRWEDDVLDRHIERAVAEVSLVAPVETEATVQTSAGSRDLDLSALTGRVAVFGVEYPVGEYPPVMPGFVVWGDVLSLRIESEPEADEDVLIRYGVLHTLDGSGTTLPERLHDLVATGAAAYAAIEWANFAVNRVNVGGPEVAREYLNWGRERLRDFVVQLDRMGSAPSQSPEPQPRRRLGVGRLVSSE
ncbi:MAG: hypothetical protein AB7U23_11560 [Dehalococcoidia bacterium]